MLFRNTFSRFEWLNELPSPKEFSPFSHLIELSVFSALIKSPAAQEGYKFNDFVIHF